MDDGAIAKELRLDVMTKDQKGTKTIQSLMIRVIVIDECQGHKCTFNQASSCSYK
jgi:hypothetical protein